MEKGGVPGRSVTRRNPGWGGHTYSIDIFRKNFSDPFQNGGKGGDRAVKTPEFPGAGRDGARGPVAMPPFLI